MKYSKFKAEAVISTINYINNKTIKVSTFIENIFLIIICILVLLIISIQ